MNRNGNTQKRGLMRVWFRVYSCEEPVHFYFADGSFFMKEESKGLSAYLGVNILKPFHFFCNTLE